MIYQNGEISVDGTFARFGGKAVAINKINSTEIRHHTTPGAKAFYLWFPLAAIFTLALAGSLAMPGGDGKMPVVITNLVLAAWFWFVGMRSFGRRHPKHRYELFLVTSSQEQQAMASDDRQLIEELKVAVEMAMAGAR